MRGGYQLGAVHGVVLKQGDPTPVPGTDLAIRIGQSYEVILADPPKGPYKVATRAHRYALEDDAENEIVAYPWHPQEPSYRPDPHLHIGYGAGGRLVRPDLRDAHLPTRRISVEEFVRCVIVDFHAP